jgi:hypothetical protein
VVAALPHRVQSSVPLLRIAASYLLLPVASLAWLELSAGKFRLFLRALIFISLAISVAGIGFFVIAGSDDALIPSVCVPVADCQWPQSRARLKSEP